VVATVSGETDLTTQLAVEQADMIRGKRIRPLATVSDKAAGARGLRHPSSRSAKTIPGFKAPANYFGIFIPKGVPPDVVVHGAEGLERQHFQQPRASKNTP
jgi:hypothetical protein